MCVFPKRGPGTYGNNLVESRSNISGDNLVGSIVTPDNSSSFIATFTYAYDANKRKTQESTANLFPTQTQNFPSYDNENRLTSWNETTLRSQTWNLTKVGDWYQTAIDGGANQTRTHTKVHETTNTGSAALHYDFKGNLTQDEASRTLTWDPENRLASATVSDTTSGASGIARYKYDALGRRVAKTVYGMVTSYILDGAQVIKESDAPLVLDSSAAADDGSLDNMALTPPGGGILQGDNIARVNFQPSLNEIPPGFLADKGKEYDVRSNEKSYGWDNVETDYAIIRNAHPLPQYDTFVQFQDGQGQTAGTWSMGGFTPGSSHAMVVVMGDASSTYQSDYVKIQGTDETPEYKADDPPPQYQHGNFDGYALTVTADELGNISIAPDTLSFNPKLCFLEINPAESTITQADIDKLAAAISDANAKTRDPNHPPTPRIFVYSDYVDAPLMMVAGSGAETKKYYFHSNHLYSVAALSDSTGVVVERYSYDAYGKQTVLEADGSTVKSKSSYGQTRGFTGYSLDEETGLYYARSRMYSPALGRFVGRDPWRKNYSTPSALDGYADGPSLYRAYYVPNHKDPSGTEKLHLSYDFSEAQGLSGARHAANQSFHVPSGTMQVIAPNQIVFDIIDKVMPYDPKGECGNCIETIHIAGEGPTMILGTYGNGAMIFPGGINTIISMSINRDTGSTLPVPPHPDSFEDASKLFSAINKYRCSDNFKLIFVFCQVTNDPIGITHPLAMYFGNNSYVFVPTAKVSYYFGDPIPTGPNSGQTSPLASGDMWGGFTMTRYGESIDVIVHYR